MDKGETYQVKNLKLKDKGLKNVKMARARMGALMKIKKRFSKEKPLKGLRIGMALHVTKETANLVKTLEAGGAEVAIASCNPLSTQDGVAAWLASTGTRVWAYKGESKEDYYKFIRNVIEFEPNLTIDDGCDLVSEVHKNYKELIPNIYGGCEETTTGVKRLRAMERDSALKYPIIAVNDNETKHLFDNYYGTGQSAIDGIIRATNILFAGKNVVIAGYGDCGKGSALRAEGLGANVIVTEVDPIRALQAKLDGYKVMPMDKAAEIGDIFLTVTGNKDVITTKHIKKMKNNAVLANAGHFDVEIDVDGLERIAESKTRIRDSLDRYTLKNKNHVYLCCEGRLVNLASAEGHPSEVMATSFCGQALAIEYIVKNKNKLENKVLSLPKELDKRIAELQLEDMGVEIDSLTEEQEEYLSSWRKGT